MEHIMELEERVMEPGHREITSDIMRCVVVVRKGTLDVVLILLEGNGKLFLCILT